MTDEKWVGVTEKDEVLHRVKFTSYGAAYSACGKDISHATKDDEFFETMAKCRSCFGSSNGEVR
jgi:hypothetical protein